MNIVVLGASSALLFASPGAVTAPIPTGLDGGAVILPLRTRADTSNTLAAEATQALTAELKKDGVAVAAVNPSLPAAKACLARGRDSASACAEVASASGVRYAFAGSLYAYAYMTHANLPVRMTLTLYEISSGQPVWTGAYGDGLRGDFSRAVSAYGDVRIGARALARSFIADPVAANLLTHQD